MSQVNWNNYACRDYYDELMAAPGQPRDSAGELCNMLARFSAEELAERKTAAEIAIRTMGITFTVYSEGAMIDRAWPFDIVPRIIPASEWRKTEAGLKQRVQALNLFIDDLYHDQKVIKDKVLPAEVLAQSVNFRPQCVGINPPHGVWAHVCGSDLVRDGDGTLYVLSFEHLYSTLPEPLWVATQATPVSSPELIAFNAPLAHELGAKEIPDSETLAQWFSGNQLMPEAKPGALGYAGHQFGNFVPQLGDGRALLLGEVIDQNGVRRDVQLKGSGRTPFSRGGDGRSPLGPVLREYLVSEFMAAMGIPTTRALAAVTSGERVIRQMAEPGAVFTRVASSHIRVGTFQFAASRRDEAFLKALADHVIERHYPDAANAEDPYLALLETVVARQAVLIARWMSVGFIHGVMNTDNCSIAGETIDYGPCACR